MTTGSRNSTHNAARDMLETFASVGADAFDLTVTTRHGEKVRFRRSVSLADLCSAVPTQLDEATRLEHNVIVRPHGPGVVFIQLDDLSHARSERVRPAAFLGLETSPQNYQAWIALRQADHDFARRLRKGARADAAASGATRIAGSFNFKDKYAPDFPRVEIAYSAASLISGKDKLVQLGVVAKTDHGPGPPTVSPHVRHYPTPTRWPSYRRCIEGAPPTHDGTRPDISRADFTWCLIAIDWGWSIEDTAARLMEESPKARENGERYAQLTSKRAAAAIEHRRFQTTRSL
jgi:hypothetical protein